eukprot:PhF_6_TR31290/c0_g1_i4/m.45849/K13126/PABPC; polyadenylate-binding protein
MPPKPAAKEAAKPAEAPKGKKAAEAPKQAAPAPKQAAKTAAPAPKAAAKAAPAATPAKKQVAAPAKQAAPEVKKGDSAGVYIKGINQGDDLDSIKKVFRSAGNIVAARRRADKYALIWYDSAAGAKKAIELYHNKQVHGNKVTVVSAKAAAPRDRAEYCKTVFLGNINPTTSRAAIRSALGSYGTITKVRTYKGGFAFVYFDNVKSAVKASSELNGKKLLDRFVSVKLSTRTKEADQLSHRQGLNRTKLWAERRKWVLKIVSAATAAK